MSDGGIDSATCTKCGATFSDLESLLDHARAAHGTSIQ